MNIKKICKRYWRMIRYTVRWLFMERLRGLDFSMRDRSTHVMTGGVMHGYSATSPSHFKKILKELNFNHNRSFIDIGCGKGLMLSLAKEYSKVSKCGGIEYNKKTADICMRNMHRLGYNDVNIWIGDAREFKDYESYDTFYFFNPFGPEIFRDVISKIPSHKTTVIYHNPTCHQLVLDTGRFHLKKQLYDKDRDYYTNIYVGIN